MRHLLYIIFYRRWLRHPNGTRALADRLMQHLLRNTIALAEKFKRKNSKLGKKLQELNDELAQRAFYQFIEPGEYLFVRGKIFEYTLAGIAFLAAELFFNFFAARAIIVAEGWVAIAGQVLLSIVVTFGFILLVKELFGEMLCIKPYKAEHHESRNTGKLLTLLVFTAIYEISVYYLCIVRGVEIEGGGHDPNKSNLMMLIGMVSPLLAGYYDYMKQLHFKAYHNTRAIHKLHQKIAVLEHRVSHNQLEIEKRFSEKCRHAWEQLQRFRNYKDIADTYRNQPVEDLANHFAETEESFTQNAKVQFKKNLVKRNSIWMGIFKVMPKKTAS